MATQTHSVKKAQAWRIGITLLLVVAGIYIVASRWQTLSGSLAVLQHARLIWLAVALVCMAGTFCTAAYIYGLLALKPLRYRQTVLIEVAASFANRLLPAGLGGLGLHDLYLHKRRHSVAQATAVVSVNNLLGITAHVLLLTIVIVTHPEVLQAFSHHYDLQRDSWLAVAGLILIAVVLLFFGRKLARFGRNMLISLRLLQSLHVLGAVVMSMALTMTYTLMLFASARSVGLAISLLQTFVIFSVAMLIGTATPTPGGLVGIEAGLFAGFVGYGAPLDQATAAVVVYRLITYWLPLLPGAAALALARSRALV